MSSLRFVIKFAVLCVLTTASSALNGGEPAPAAERTPSKIAVGYSYVNLGFSGKPRVNLNGLEIAQRLTFNPNWGAVVNSSYVRAAKYVESGRGNYVLSAFVGLVFVPLQNRNDRLLVRALLGISG